MSEREYAVAVLVLNGVGAATVASHVQAQLSRRIELSFALVYTCVLALVALWGIVIVGQDGGPWNLTSWRLLWAGFAVFGGEISFRGDVALLRWAGRRDGRRGGTIKRGSVRRGVRGFAGGAARVAPRAITSRGTSDPLSPLSIVAKVGLPAALTIGLLEEVVYRGLLIRTGLELPLPLATLAVAGLMVAFCFAHLRFGWHHVLSKAPLSVIATCLALGPAGVLGALVAHGWFNLRIWDASKRHAAAALE